MTYEQILDCLKYIQERSSFKPEIGIILGTGLGGLVNDIDIVKTFDYAELPHFPISTVETHRGHLILGYLNKKPIVVMQGRFHYYEGYSMKQITFPVRVMKLLGIETLYISNVSGGLNNTYEAGDLVVITDHINLQTENPLTGKNIDEMGVRFPDMIEPYDTELFNHAYNIGKSLNINIHKGVYVSVPGPNLETRAEYKFLSMIGADCVGMSTVPEVIVAAQMGLKVLAISIVTDLCYEPRLQKTNIHEIIKIANESEPKLTQIFKHMLQNT
ncbi:MAG: purine-nucleoside phosphorylase [Bacteroidetes bacterium]|nr:purine-nucleoside phosphorylase [Bacteroidota bacterium]